MAYIYKVRNVINNKVYIGKTNTSVSLRWNRHIRDAFSTVDGYYKYDFKFYRAIRKYGWRNFEVTTIGEYPDNIISQKEVEYISIYDSYHKGYNSTLGGEGNSKIEISSEDAQLCIEMYKSGDSYNKICDTLGLPLRRVMDIIHSSIPDKVRTVKDQMKPVAMLDKKWNKITEFESIAKVVEYLKENYNPCIKDTNVYYLVKKAALNGNTAYGYHWMFL